jgi:hypothetical protein
MVKSPYDGRIFIYPDNSGKEFSAEKRAIPHKNSRDARIRVFLEELFLGPVTFEFSRTVPHHTCINHVVVDGKTAYIGLDSGILKTDKELVIPFSEALVNLGRNIKFNFPGLDKIVFTIDGKEVYAPYFSSDMPEE